MNRRMQIVLMTVCMALLLAWGGFGTAQAMDSIGFNIYIVFDPGWWSVYPNQVAGFTDVQESIWYSQWIGDPSGTNDSPIVDNHGIETLLAVSWTAPNTGNGQNSQPGTQPADWADAAGNPNLYVGYLESTKGNPLTFTLTNIPYASYDVYVYMNRNGADSGTDGSIAVGGATYYYHPIVGWNGVFTRATRTTPPSPAGTAPAANYCKFAGLTGATQTITAATIGATDNGGAISGFQIVNAGEMPRITLYPPSPAATETGPADFPASYMWATTMTLTPDKVSLLPSGGSVSGTVEILNPTSANPTIRVRDLTGFGSLRVLVLPGSASNATGTAGFAGPSLAVDVTPGAVPTAPAMGGMNLWWDASSVNNMNNSGITDGDRFATWKDRSGNGNDGIARGAGAVLHKAVPALNGKAAAEFHCDRDNEAYNFTTTLTNVRTVFWVFRKKPHVDPEDWHYYWLGCRPGEWGSNTGAWSGEGWTYRIWGSTFYPTGNEIMNGVTRVLGEVVNATQPNSQPRDVDSILSLETTGNCVASFFCGHDRPGGGNASAWRGTLSELIIYNRPLTKQEMNTTGRYLGNKYGLDTKFGYTELPKVTLVNPGASLHVAPNATVELRAMATPGEGATIAAMEFYVDWQLVGTVTTLTDGEGVFSWIAPGALGSHEVFARALDSRTPALAAASAVGTITVAEPPPPIFATPASAGTWMLY